MADHPRFADLMPLFMGTLMLNDATNVADINEQLPAVAEHIRPQIKDKIVDFAHHLQPAPAPPLVDNITWRPTGDHKIKTDRAVVLEKHDVRVQAAKRIGRQAGPAPVGRRRAGAEARPLRPDTRRDDARELRIPHSRHARLQGLGRPGRARRRRLQDLRQGVGRLHVNDDNILDAFRRFLFNRAAGVDDDVARAVALAFKADLEHVRDVLEQERSRMYSSSLLFVFEGDGDALRAAVDEASASAAADSDKGAKDGGRSNPRVDSGIDVDENGDMIPQALDEDEEDDDDDDEGDDINLPRIYGLKLIDFAHAKWVPHEEKPDENVLLGVRSLIKTV